MPSAKKTSLGFNDWQTTDKAKTADLAADNQLANKLISEVQASLLNKANKGASQNFDLPLSTGFTTPNGQRAEYWKNEYSEVTLCINLFKEDGFPREAQFATLPVGFRPASLQTSAAIFATPTSGAFGVINVNTNGVVSLQVSGLPAGQTMIYGRACITFLANE